MEPNLTRDRDAAITWARQMTGEFVVLDTETTGMQEDDEVIQLGIVNQAGKVLLDCLLKPQKPISPGATTVHGIGDSDVAGAVDILAIIDVVARILSGKQVLIYNAGFDTRLVNQSLYQRGAIDWFSWSQVHCVMEWFSQFYGDWNDYHRSYRWQKLTQAAQHFGISTTGAHGAAADALMTLRVVKAMAESKLSTE